MHLREILAAKPHMFSFEFFPPKSQEGVEALIRRAADLSRLRPSFVSVTYGAGGTTRDRTREVVFRLHEQVGLATAAHLTCVGHSRREIVELLQQYAERGVANIVALRGDPPDPTRGFEAHAEGFTYANELVELIREQFGDRFGVAVAGYPEGHTETPSHLDGMDHLKRKVDAGADVVITQLFFDNRDFYDFCERAEMARLNVPIIAGIMPVLSRRSILRMAGLCGARIPSKLLGRLERAGDDNDAVARIGIDWATQQCRDLLDHQVRGIHFYTLNHSDATVEIYRRLGATDSEALASLAEG